MVVMYMSWKRQMRSLLVRASSEEGRYAGPFLSYFWSTDFGRETGREKNGHQKKHGANITGLTSHTHKERGGTHSAYLSMMKRRMVSDSGIVMPEAWSTSTGTLACGLCSPRLSGFLILGFPGM